MTRRTAYRKLTFGTLAVVLLAIGAAVAIASGTSSTRQPTARLALSSTPARASGEVAVAAGYLGVTRAQLREKLRSGETLAQVAQATPGRSVAGLIDAIVDARAKRVEAASADGRIPAARASRLLAALRRRVTATVEGSAAGGRSRRPALETAAGYLGLTLSSLRSQLRAGRTLAEIAAATPGRSQAGLVAALIEARRAQLEAMLAANHRRQSSEEAQLSTLQQRVRALVNRRLIPAR